EHQAGVGFARTDNVVDFTVLAGTTRLLLVGVAVFHFGGDGFAVGHLGLTHNQLNAVGTLQNVYLDVQVQFAHTFEDGFTGVFVGFNAEGRVFGNQLADGHAHLLGTAFVLRRNGDGDHRLGEHHGFQGAGVLDVTQGVTGLHVLHADDGDDVAGLGGVQ